MEDDLQQPDNNPRGVKPRHNGCWGSAISVLCVLIVLVICFMPWPEKPFKPTEFERVVGMITSGTLKPDARGVVVLPKDLAYLTSTGHVYVSQGAHKSTLIFFPSWLGRHTIIQDPIIGHNGYWLSGYLYDSGRPKLPDDVPGDDIFATVNGPAYTQLWNAHSDGRLTRSELYLNGRQMKANWYPVTLYGP